MIEDDREGGSSFVHIRGWYGLKSPLSIPLGRFCLMPNGMNISTFAQLQLRVFLDTFLDFVRVLLM